MTTVTMDQAQANLPELVAGLEPGGEVAITQGERVVARLVAGAVKQPRPAPGLGRGTIVYMAPDFDATTEEFGEYLR